MDAERNGCVSSFKLSLTASDYPGRGWRIRTRRRAPLAGVDHPADEIVPFSLHSGLTGYYDLDDGVERNASFKVASPITGCAMWIRQGGLQRTDLQPIDFHKLQRFSSTRVIRMTIAISKLLPFAVAAMLATLGGPVSALNMNTTIQEGRVNINRTYQVGDNNDNATYQNGMININRTIQIGGNNRNQTGQFGRFNRNQTDQGSRPERSAVKRSRSKSGGLQRSSYRNHGSKKRNRSDR